MPFKVSKATVEFSDANNWPLASFVVYRICRWISDHTSVMAAVQGTVIEEPPFIFCNIILQTLTPWGLKPFIQLAADLVESWRGTQPGPVMRYTGPDQVHQLVEPQEGLPPAEVNIFHWFPTGTWLTPKNKWTPHIGYNNDEAPSAYCITSYKDGEPIYTFHTWSDFCIRLGDGGRRIPPGLPDWIDWWWCLWFVAITEHGISNLFTNAIQR